MRVAFARRCLVIRRRPPKVTQLKVAFGYFIDAVRAIRRVDGVVLGAAARAMLVTVYSLTIHAVSRGVKKVCYIVAHARDS